ncbi:MAG: hypothetical protein MJZ29_09435 [Bacteroidaceae bacterium]|nr:hypothetical protein [Bacteroidaceae bacterium]
MKELKTYNKPRFTIIKIRLESQLLDGSITDDEGIADIKAQTFRIFDDSFDDDLSSIEESDYATTTNTIEVW